MITFRPLFRASKSPESTSTLMWCETVETRALQAKMSDVKRLIYEHGAKLRLFSNAEDRIAAIVNMNNNFLEIMSNLNSNMTSLHEACNEVLNELHGNLAGLASMSKAAR